MTGSADATTPSHAIGFPALHRFFAVDGGAGAHTLAALADIGPELQRVLSPRHANLLLIVEPLAATMREPLVEIARAMPQPSQVFIVETAPAARARDQRLDVDAVLHRPHRLAASSPGDIFRACKDAKRASLRVVDKSERIPDTVTLPAEPPEMATELAVLSLGPIQPYTAGPLRIVLICDGEQIDRAEVSAGYAFRGIAAAMATTTWEHAADLAATLDPLAPVAGRLAYVQAIEALQHWQPPAALASERAATLAIERAGSHLWWFVRFARLLGAHRLADRAREIAWRLDRDAASRPDAWIAPQSQRSIDVHAAPAELHELARALESLAETVNRDRLLRLRCKGLGVLSFDDALRHGVSGPALMASKNGHGDTHARIVARLGAALFDLRSAAQTEHGVESLSPAKWHAPRGKVDASTEGPRGAVGLSLHSDGGDGPTRVEWRRPSAAMLKLLPALLQGQILADAEVIIASLDIAMAEADG